MSNEKTLESEFDLSEQRPLAGEIRKFPLGEALFFSPKPIPSTKMVPGGLGRSNQVLKINDVYMDIGQSSAGKAFQVQVAMSPPVAVFCVSLSILLAGSYVTKERYSGFIAAFIDAIQDSLIVFFPIVMLLAIGWFVIIQSSLKKARTKPIRFNRQRREVCYFEENSNTPIIVPWEEVVCWVSVYQGYTGNTVVANYTFGFALPDAEGEDYWRFQMPVALMEDGQRCWEVLRCYMEEPPEYWPQMEKEENRKTFEEKHKQIKQRFLNGDRYWVRYCMHNYTQSYLGMLGYYVFNLLSCWKLPYLVSEWDSKISMAKFPDEIKAWSAAIPEDEWAKPSEELLRQRAKAEAHYAKGGKLTTLKL
ncbi:DUF6708 domain-containing protein [Vibrio sp. C8]